MNRLETRTAPARSIAMNSGEGKNETERFRLLVEYSADLIIEADDKGCCTYANPATTTHLGYLPAELLGTRLSDLVDPGDFESTQSCFSTPKVGSPPGRRICRLRHKQGEYIWMDFTTSAYEDSPGDTRLICMAKDASVAMRAEASLKDTLTERNLMMKELQHRVKNSLAIVSSLLSLKKSSLRDKPSIEVFRSAQARIRSIAGLYEELYRSPDNDKVNFRQYIEHLALSIMETYGGDAGNIKINSELEDIHLDAKRAISLGLIVNELVTNSIKYAYEGKICGEISIELRQLGSYVVLVVRDQGRGLPADFDPATSTGLGVTLVRAFSQQLGGGAEFQNEVGGGAKVSISFRL